MSVIATKNIINTPKIALEKSPIVVKPNVVTSSTIATKPKIASKPNVVTSKKKKAINYNKHLDHNDKYKGIKDLKHLFGETIEEINEKVNEEINEDDYYKPILANSFFKGGYKEYESRGDKDKTLLVEQYLDKIIPYLKELINNDKAINNGSNK